MTKQEIREGAPDGATHYENNCWGAISYWKNHKGLWWYFDGKEWDSYSATMPSFIKPL